MTRDFSSEAIRKCHIFWVPKPLMTQKCISTNDIQRWRGNQDILKWRKTKKIYCQQTYPKRAAKGSSWNKKGIKEILEHQEGKQEERKEQKYGKYNALSFSSWVSVIFDGWSKKYSGAWCDPQGMCREYSGQLYTRESKGKESVYSSLKLVHDDTRRLW